MRAGWCGFAVGVIVLQRQAALPDWRGWLALTTLGVLAFGLSWALSREAVRWGACGSGADAPCAAGFAARSRAIVGSLALACAAACVGFGYAAMRAELRLANRLSLEWEARDLVVTGSVKGLPSYDAHARSTRFLFDVDTTDAPVKRFPPVLQLTWLAADSPAPRLIPGERWRLTVRLKRAHGNANFGLRDAEAGLLERNVRATGYVSAPTRAQRLAGGSSGLRGLGVTVDRWRAALRERIDRVLGDAPHRGIVVALAIGAQDEVSDADWQLMRATGTSHLVAISGLHIGFVASLAGWLAGALWRRSAWVGRNWPLLVPAQIVAATAGLACAALHAALAGFNVPAQRALWMAAVVALAFIGGRQLARSTVLAWALGLVLLLDPWAVLAAGFWLSFCAVAAILFALSGRPRVRTRDDADDPADDDSDRRARALRRLRAALHRPARRAIERIRGAAHVQLAVTVALAPLTVFWFSQIPLVGPLANAFAIPWVSALVTPTVLAAVVLPAPLDGWLWHAAHLFVEWLAVGLRMLSGPAWTLWWLPQPHAWTLAAAALGVFWWLAPRGWPLRWAAPLTWLPLVLPASAGPPSGDFRLTALDVGQGSAVLIETARHALLFDAGPGPESTHAGERVVVPFLHAHGLNALDTLVVSHADSDHAGGAPSVLGSIAVRQMLASLAPGHPLWSNAREHGARTVRCAAGQRWQWDGVEFAMLWPDPGPLRDKTNAHSCVLRVSSARSANGTSPPARATALLSADIEAPTERVLLARDPAALHAQVLLVPHHGSRTSSTEPFVDAVEPSVALFQVGYRNRFGHPHAQVFERYRLRDIVLARSDRDGAMRIDASAGVTGTNGATLVLERYRDRQRRYWMER